MRWVGLLLASAPVAAVLIFGAAGPALAQPDGCPPVKVSYTKGFAARTVVSGLPFQESFVDEAYGVSGGACLGSWGVAFSGNHLFVTAPGSPGGLYRFGLAGGRADAGHQLNSVPFQSQPVTTRGGTLYLPVIAGSPTNGRIVQIDPASGAVARTLASGLSCPQYLAADPISGDLFFQDGCTGSPYNPTIFRLSNPTSANPVVTNYVANLPNFVNGLAFAPDGTLYAAVSSGPILRISGTDGPATPTVATIASVTDPTGVAIATATKAGAASALWVAEYGGAVDRIDLTSAPATTTQILRGETNLLGLDVGPDGCPYLSTTSALVTFGRTGTRCAGAAGEVSTIASALPNPSQAFPSVAVVAAALVIAAGGTLFITFPAQLFNLTFQENYAEILGWWRRSVRWVTGIAKRKPASHEEPNGTERHRAGTHPLVFGLVMVAGAALGALLDPRFGLNWTTTQTVVAVVLSIAFGVTLGAAVAARYHRRSKQKVPHHLHALPLGLLVAALCVAVSRLSDFQPGYLYGVVCGVVFEREMNEREEGQLAAMSTASVVAISVLAYFIRVPVESGAATPSAFFGLVVLDDLLSSIVVGGLVGSTIALLPLRFLPGASIKKWNRAVWAGLFGAVAFLLVTIVIRGAGAGASHSGVAVTVTLFAVFAGGSVAFREYFAHRWRVAHGVSIHGVRARIADLFASHAGPLLEPTQLEQAGGVSMLVEQEEPPAPQALSDSPG
jgi:hypothetical protein